jgi:hypothetical protein
MNPFSSRDGFPVRNVYIDESSQTKARFLVLGGITVMAQHAAPFETFLRWRRHPELPSSEMKWTKVSRGKLLAYERVVTEFFDPPWRKFVQFHSLVVDTHKQNHARFNLGSREIGFNKEIYQLCQKFRRVYGSGVLHVYPDSRDTPQPTEELRSILNFGARKKGDSRPWPFRRLHFVSSAASQIIQLTDILTGAVAFRVNGRHSVEGASPAKIALADHIMGLAGIRDASRETAATGKFTIWHRQLRE